MLAAELVALQPQVLFTHTSNAAAAAARVTRSIPIVVGPAGEMMLRELAGGSLARPSTNVTGFVLGSAEIDDKCVMLLMEAVPAARRVGVLINPGNPGQQRYTAALKGSLAVPGKVLIRLESSGPADIDAAMAKAKAEHIAALFIADDALIAGDAVVRQRVLRFAAASGVAVASSHQNFARGGALLAMGPSLPDLAARAAGYVDRILKGAQPSDLPVQLPTVWSVIVNLKVAKALGLTIPPAILARADEVIQ
jgi:putative ABC transport system substrate-binding protein